MLDLFDQGAVQCQQSRRSTEQMEAGWKIFAINHNGTDYYPSCGLDAESGARPIKALSSIIHIFDGKRDAWGMAYWFHSVNSFLGGQRPKDLLVKSPARVISAAEDEVQENSHG